MSARSPGWVTFGVVAVGAPGGPTPRTGTVTTSDNGCVTLDTPAPVTDLPRGFPPETEGPPRASGNPIVRFTTNQGDLRFDLDRSIAPCNVQNFVDLAGADFFDGTTCHRLSTTAGLPIIQCGDPTGTGTGGPGFTVKDEFPRDYPPATGYADAVTYPRGVIAMAGSTTPNSAGSQFFVTYGDAAITPRFSVIGRASNETLAVIEKVAAGGNDDGLAPGDGRPNITLTIQTSRLG